MNVVRAVSSEGHGRLHYHSAVRKLLDTDTTVHRYFDGESDVLPSFYEDRMRRDLGSFMQFSPMAPPGMTRTPISTRKRRCQNPRVRSRPCRRGARRARAAVVAAASHPPVPAPAQSAMARLRPRAWIRGGLSGRRAPPSRRLRRSGSSRLFRTRVSARMPRAPRSVNR